MTFRKFWKVLAGGVAALVLSAAMPAAQASYIQVVDGINFWVGYSGTSSLNYSLPTPPSGSPYTAGYASYYNEQVANGVPTGSGYGYFTGFSTSGTVTPTTPPSYCASGNSSCLLTYTFSGADTQNGTLNVYANDTSNFSTAAFPTTDQSAEAAQGNLFLSLSFQLLSFVNGTYTAYLYPTTYNGMVGSANHLLVGPEMYIWSAGSVGVGGAPTGYTGGTGNGQYFALPEPSDLGMMGFGLLMIGLMGLRFRQSRFRRT